MSLLRSFTDCIFHADIIVSRDDLLVKFEYNEIKTAIGLGQREVEVGWRTLFTTPQNRKRLIILFFLAFSSQWSAYPIKKALISIGITSSNAHLLIGGILQVWNLSWALFASSLVDKVGRRILFLTSIVGMTVFFSLQAACSTAYAKSGNDNHAGAYAAVAFIFLFYTFYDLAFVPLFVAYTVEIFPYPLRAKGLALFNFALSVSFIVNQYARSPFGLGKLTFESTSGRPLY